ncbi:MAG TPA: cytochrome c biogenesis protein DipZ [Gaiellaceae bacterium]|nr:cytochrome c biogenesis protein DipZ [Gaiellaceae bacterium]
MILLIGIGLVAGVATAVSPCVLPVLPLLLAGGASGRKPLRIVAGLVLSFSVFTLFATWILDHLGLPDDTLRNLAIAFLFVMAAVLLVPQAGLLVERGLAFFSRLRPADAGGGYFLGVSLGLVFVPCAGPFLGALSAAAAHESFGVRTIVATLAYALGAAVPMLVIAYGGRELATRIRQHAPSVRLASGAVIAVVALGLVFHVDDHLTQVRWPWTSYVQDHVEASKSSEKQLARLRGEKAPPKPVATATKGLPDYGAAPPLTAGGAWINTKPLTLAQLRGKVVLVDFWTYSCINCLRTLPHLKAWYATYRKDGLVILGVHTPEFAFEHETSNVEAAVKRLGIAYPVMQDNDYKTWDAYSNQYWPAEYLIDKTGRIRHTHFGEGEYGQTEQLIRQLLDAKGARAPHVADTTPDELMTPETYLGYERLSDYVGSKLHPDELAGYTLPSSVPDNGVAYGGQWKVGGQAAVAGRGARLQLHFQAKDVYIVLGGHGTVQALVDGKPERTLDVNAYRLYTVRQSSKQADALLELRFSPGVQAYSFTFG